MADSKPLPAESRGGLFVYFPTFSNPATSNNYSANVAVLANSVSVYSYARGLEDTWPDIKLLLNYCTQLSKRRGSKWT